MGHLLLAAGMGAVGGLVLSFAQWLVLSGKVQRAGLWIPANMLAWTFGMPVVFWGIDLAFKMPEIWQSVLVMAGALLLTGTIVGAIEGGFLVRMAEDVPFPSRADVTAPHAYPCWPAPAGQ